MNSNSLTGTVPLDYDLVRRAQEGDADAFSALFHAHKARVYSVCSRMTNSTAEAEDLTQDTFLQVFRKIGMFRGHSAFSTWLHRIAINTVLMHFRKKSLRQVSLDEPYCNNDHVKIRREYGAEDDRLAGCIDRVALARAIKELPRGYRTIFLLHEVHGYEHQEIAEMFACSVGNSKSQLHKAKLRIRRLLAHSSEVQSTEAPMVRQEPGAKKPSIDKRCFPSGPGCSNAATIKHAPIDAEICLTAPARPSGATPEAGTFRPNEAASLHLDYGLATWLSHKSRTVAYSKAVHSSLKGSD